MKFGTGQIAYMAEGVGGGGDIVAPPPTTPPAGETAHPVVAAPWAAATDVWNLGEGDAAKPWYEAIPEPEAREHVKAKGYKNPAELALANYSLTKMQRNPGEFVTLPPADATPEQLTEFYTKLGRPATKDAYDLKMGEGVTADPKMVEFGKDVAFELGLNPTQAQKLTDKWNAFAAELGAGTLEQQNAANEAEIAALETKLGGKEAMKPMMDAGLTALKALGPEGADIVTRVEGAIGTAAVVELMVLIGKRMGEGSIPNVPPANPNDPASMTREAAQAKITQLQGDAAFQAKYTDAKHPEHAASVELMKVLFSR